MLFYIKKLSSNDLLLAQDLIKEWSLDEGIKNPKLPQKAYLNKLLTKDDFHIYVAIQDQKVVGGLTAYELPMFDTEINEIFLYEIGVSENYRRQGIAKALIQQLVEYCQQNNIEVIFLGTELENDAAKQLYLSTGGAMEIIPWFTYELKK